MSRPSPTPTTLRRLYPGPMNEAGTAPLELALITVPILALVMFVVLTGRVVQVRGSLDGAARSGARAAATARSAPDAHTAAEAAIQSDIADADLPCDTTAVAVDTSSFGAGGTVTVELSCGIRVSDLGPLPVPGTQTIVSRSVAVVDAYRGTT